MKNKRLDYKFQVVIIVHAVRERENNNSWVKN